MEGQTFAPEQQVLLFHKAHRVLAQQGQLLAAADVQQRRGDLVGVDAVGLVPGQAQQHGAVGAVAPACGAERAEQLGVQLLGGAQQARRLELAGKVPGGNHGAHGVRAGRADADLEEVENADGHGVCAERKLCGLKRGAAAARWQAHIP